MPATYSLDIEKRLNEEFWTNRYMLSNPSIESALLTADLILAAERAVHFNNVTFTRYRVSDVDPSTDVFVIVPVNLQGVKALGASSILPLFNVVRVDFPAGVGRPSRKYLRLPIIEEWNESGNLPLAVVSDINNLYGNVLGGINEFVDVDGEPLGSGTAQQKIAMRQLRRGSKRRTTPVLP